MQIWRANQLPKRKKGSKTEKIKPPNLRKGLFPRISAVFHCINFVVAMFLCLYGYFPDFVQIAVGILNRNLNHRRVYSPMLCIAQTSTECSEVGANTPLLRSRRQTLLWCLSACTGEVYFNKNESKELLHILSLFNLASSIFAPKPICSQYLIWNSC